MNKKGFTLIEILIVISIIVILAVLAMAMFTSNLSKSRDSKRKADLHRLKIAFEDYYGDHNCYPPAEFFDDSSDCNSPSLAPYLASMPCDKRTGMPYQLETDVTGCSWFKLYGTLETATQDPQALAQCNLVGSNLGNYGVSSSNTSVQVYCPPQAESDPSASGSAPTPIPGSLYYYCSSVGNCTNYNPHTNHCTPNYINNPDCDGGANKCQTVGTCTQL